MASGKLITCMLVAALLLCAVQRGVGQDVSGDGWRGTEDVFASCECEGASCPKQAADVTMVLDVTDSMWKYFSMVQRMVERVEAGLRAQGMGLGACRNVYSLTVYGMANRQSCGQTIDYIEEKFVFAEDFPDLMREMRAIAFRHGLTSCEDGWQALSSALHTQRRTHYLDQTCVQLLTVLVTNEDRDECCDRFSSAQCCRLSRDMTRDTLVRQLRRTRAELAVVVDQEIFDSQHVFGQHFYGGARSRVGYVKDATNQSGYSRSEWNHLGLGYKSTQQHYSQVALKQQVDGSVWTLSRENAGDTAFLSAFSAHVARETADCSKIRGTSLQDLNLPPTTEAPTTSTEPPLTPMPPAPCKHPENISNADLVFDSPAFPVAVETTVTWRCRRGYRATGILQQQCVRSGSEYEWVPRQAGGCEEIVCSNQTAPQNGILFDANSKHLPSDSVRFSCLRGYRLVGDSRLTCLSTGRWEGLLNVAPVCEPWTQGCTDYDPSLPPGGELNIQSPRIPKPSDQAARNACVVVTTTEDQSSTDVHAWLQSGFAATGLEQRLFQHSSNPYQALQFCLVGVRSNGGDGVGQAIVHGCSTPSGFQMLAGQLKGEGPAGDVLLTLSDRVSQQVCNNNFEARVDIIIQPPNSPQTHDVAALVKEANYRSSVVMVLADVRLNLVPARASGPILAMDRTGIAQVATTPPSQVQGLVGSSEAERLAFATGGSIFDSQYLRASTAASVRQALTTALHLATVDVLVPLASSICRRCWCGSLAPSVSCGNLHMLRDETCQFGTVP